MGELRRRMLQDLKLAGYSPSTTRIYLHYAQSFAKHFMRSPAEMGAHEVRHYLLYLLEERKMSHDAYRQAYAAIKFLFNVTLDRPLELKALPRHRRQRRLPAILAGSEVQALLAAVESPKYRLLLMTVYGAGLRVAEACRVRVSDIDSKRGVINVRQGKGGKDRIVMLPDKLLDALREYWQTEKPADYLFPGRYGRSHVAPASVRAVLECATAAVGIKKKVTPHVLRHSFATHLFELGTDSRVIQALLGHSHIATTSVYIGVSTEFMQRVRSPLDVLGSPEASVLG